METDADPQPNIRWSLQNPAEKGERIEGAKRVKDTRKLSESTNLCSWGLTETKPTATETA